MAVRPIHDASLRERDSAFGMKAGDDELVLLGLRSERPEGTEKNQGRFHLGTYRNMCTVYHPFEWSRAGGSDAMKEQAHTEGFAGKFVTEMFEYDGGRQVTVYVPPDRPEAI